MRDAIVVGGSLSGLFCGIALKRAGWHVRIFERSVSVEAQGAGIVTSGDVQAFFNRFDMTNTLLYVQNDRGRQYLRRDGTVLSEEPRVQRMSSWDKLYYVLRANFDGFVQEGYLDNPIPKDDSTTNGQASYHLGHYVRSYEFDQTKERVVLKYVTPEDQHEQTTTADFVCAAEGASSEWRDAHLPGARREYTGYVAVRGLVSEYELSQDTMDLLVGKLSFFHSKNLQCLSYLIPGAGGTVSPRRMNLVWYINAAEDSPEQKLLMTDRKGRRHPYTMRSGELTDDALSYISSIATSRLPPAFIEVYQRCKKPFLQAITDVRADRAVFPDSRVILIGDALCGPRPHAAEATSQAAYHALLLYELVKDGGGWNEWRERLEGEGWQTLAMKRAEWVSDLSRSMGDTSQFGTHPLADNLDT